MPRHYREVDQVTDLIVRRLHVHAEKKLVSGEYDDGEHGSMKELMLAVEQEYEDGRLYSRVRRYLTRNPLLLREPAVVWSEMFKEIANDMIAEIVGNFKILKGVEAEDMWLSPGSPIQRMMMDRTDEDAVMVIYAKKMPDGTLEPSVFWTKNEEIIAEAQKGHQKYMTLLAQEGKP